MARLFLNPHIFFVVRDQCLYVWNYQTDEQFSLELKFLRRLLYWSACSLEDTVITSTDQQLLQYHLLLDEHPATEGWVWDERARIFFEGTKLLPQALAHISESEWLANYMKLSAELPLPQREVPLGEAISLPPFDSQRFANINFYEVIMKRRTSRNFTSEALSLFDVSQLLWITFGAVHNWQHVVSPQFHIEGLFQRTSPSGGGLHPTDAYIVACHVTGLQKGIYYYHCSNHQLIFISPLPAAFRLSDYLVGQFWANELPLGAFCVTDFSVMWDKYTDARALRVALMDVGHLSQTFLLSSTAMNLCSWLSGAFEDDKVHALLGLSKGYLAPLLFLGAGYGQHNPIPAAGVAMENQSY